MVLRLEALEKGIDCDRCIAPVAGKTSESQRKTMSKSDPKSKSRSKPKSYGTVNSLEREARCFHLKSSPSCAMKSRAYRALLDRR